MGLHNVLVIGAGVVGGSYIHALLEKRKDLEVSVVEKSIMTREAIENLGSVKIYKDIESVAEAFDVIIVALPEAQTVLCLATLPQFLMKEDSMLITCTSSKQQVSRVAVKAGHLGQHIGIHPLFGSEKRGFQVASATLVEGSTVVICVDEDVLPKYEACRELMVSLGHQVRFMNDSLHDLYFANTSHLTHVMAILQKGLLPLQDTQLMPPSYRVAARISESDPALWSEILWYNREALGSVIEQVRMALEHLQIALEEPSQVGVERWLKQCQNGDVLGLFRNQIDQIDSQMVTLLEKRLQTAKALGHSKRRDKQVVLDVKRENTVKQSVVNNVHHAPLTPAILQIYETIFAQSRTVQGG